MISLKRYGMEPGAQAYLDDRFANASGDNGTLGYGSAWFGIGACDRLGLHGNIRRDQVLALCENRHPLRGGVLREPGDAHSTPLFAELIVSLPRLAAVLMRKDERIQSVHHRAFDEVMRSLEVHAAAPCWRDGFSCLAITSNIVAACFDCFTLSAGVELLHTHLLLFNLTFLESDEEQGWKALDFAGVEEMCPDLGALYPHLLCRELRDLGYASANEELLHTFERKALLGLN